MIAFNNLEIKFQLTVVERIYAEKVESALDTETSTYIVKCFTEDCDEIVLLIRGEKLVDIQMNGHDFTVTDQTRSRLKAIIRNILRVERAA